MMRKTSLRRPRYKVPWVHTVELDPTSPLSDLFQNAIKSSLLSGKQQEHGKDLHFGTGVQGQMNVGEEAGTQKKEKSKHVRLYRNPKEIAAHPI